ncbi:MULTISPECIES: FepA family TonB-dependent siderophore receptor [unclassified Lonepinella]|uniref:FepA family TonB-dependent siderophore receptor n=1 Tax=unclassified Lonepinella TaxID=2642006 RepID=UPI0036DF94C4
MKTNKTKLALAILSVLGAANAFAVEQLEQITVTAEDQVKQSLGVSIISSGQLDKRPIQNDISEILRTMPGVNLTGNSATSNRGNKRQIDLRGMGPENTLILIDGKPVTSRQAERMGRSGERNTRGDSNWVPVEAIDSIEVLRGPAAARYGSGAMGGVVNIKTKPTTDKLTGSVTYYTNQPEDSKEGATNRVGFNLSGPIISDVLNFRLYGNYNKTEADAVDINAANNGSNTLIAGREGVRNKDISGRLDWKINQDHQLRFDASYSRQGNIYGGDTQTSAITSTSSALINKLIGSETARLYRQSYSLTHTGKYSWGDSETYVSWDRTTNSRMSEYLTGRVEGSYDSTDFSDSVLKNTHVGTEFHIPFTVRFEQMLTVGAEFTHSSLDDANSLKNTLNSGETYNGFSNTRPSNISQKEWAIFVEDNIALADSTFLTPAIRYDYNDHSGSNVSGGVNFAHNFTDAWKVKGGIARAYKAPNLYQSNSNYMITSYGYGCPVADGFVNCAMLGNDNLKPETSWNKEIGLEYQHNALSASLAYFHNDYRNKIVAGTTVEGQTSSGRNIYRWENVKKAVVSGLEGNLTLPLIENKLQLVNNFTYMIESKNKATGNPLSVIPKYTINSSLNWIINDMWDTNLTYTQYGRQKPRSNKEINNDTRNWNETELGSYAIFGANVGFNWNKALSLRVGVTNMFDKRIYRSNQGANSYNEPGRAYYVTAKYSF